MALDKRSQGALSSGISQGINLDERYTFTSTGKDDLVADFESKVDRRLGNRLSHINSAYELSMVSRGLKFMLNEKLKGHEMQRRKFWNTKTSYQNTTETSCAISDSGKTELFMFKIVGGVKITEKYVMFMRFVKYEADLHWMVMSLESSENEGRKQLRTVFNIANTSEDGGRKIDDAMVALSNPSRRAISSAGNSKTRVTETLPSIHKQPQCNAEQSETNRQRKASNSTRSTIKKNSRRQESVPRHGREISTKSTGRVE